MPKVDAQVAGPEEVPAPTPLFQTAILASLAIAILCLFLFAWLGREILAGDTLRFDDAVRGWVHQFASPGLTRVMIALSALGYGFLLFALLIAFMFFARLRWLRAAAWLAVTMSGALLLDLTLKYAYHRHRPKAFFGASPESYSYPSGHALCSLCFYGVLAGLLSARIQPLLWRIVIWSAAALLVIAIGFSRIYLGVHYPSDVLGGYLAATVWVGTVIVLDHMRKVRRHRKQRSTK
jgi:membrane-associated phospholipid phosphatase